MTRVSAHYIRKFCKKYDIEITQPLRTKAVKAMYVEMIAEAIIADELRNEIREQNIAYLKEINEALKKNVRFHSYDIEYINFSAKIGCGSKLVGQVGVDMFHGIWYRAVTDGRMVRRRAASLTQAIDALVTMFMSSVRPSKAV